ncbi:MAG: proline dehydrogenase family protein, partial [Pseudomonadota bacterium]
MRTALGPIAPWRSRADELARALAATSGGPILDVQRVFSLLPPDRPAGEAAFRLVEALPRTMDRASRIALLREYVPPLRNLVLARVALPVAGLAIRAIGGQFVYGQRIEDALARALRTAAREPRARFSFDMLGEGARTADDAARNFSKYAGAIEALGRAAGTACREPQDRLGVSVKLSSIHARYDAQSYPLVRGELLGRLIALCRAGSACGIGLTIDAEESERLPLQLDLFAALASHPDFLQWPGLGLAVQAYHREILETLERIAAMARRRVDSGGKALCVRLVKGAYWDAEVRRAQELGL